MSVWYKTYLASHHHNTRKKMEVDFMMGSPSLAEKEETTNNIIDDNSAISTNLDQTTTTTNTGSDPDQDKENDFAPKLSYANVAKGRKNQDGFENQNTESSSERKQRVFTIYRLATAIPSEGSIARAIGNLFEKEPREVIEKIQRDTRYRSKYNILFKRKDDCDFIIRNGITIEGQKIGGKQYHHRPHITHIYIPNFPSSGTRNELFTILSQHVSVSYVRERFHQDLGIAVGGWKAGVLRELGKRIPDTITYEDEVYDVIYPGKERRKKVTPQVSEDESESIDWSKPQKSKALNNHEMRAYIDEINYATIRKDLEMSESEEEGKRDEEMEISAEKQQHDHETRDKDNEKSEMVEEGNKSEDLKHDKDGFIKVKSTSFKKKKVKRPKQKLVDKQIETIALFATPKDFVVPETIKSRGEKSDCLNNLEIT